MQGRLDDVKKVDRCLKCPYQSDDKIMEFHLLFNADKCKFLLIINMYEKTNVLTYI